VRTPVGAWLLSAEKEEIDMAWIHPDARYYYDWGEVPSARSGRAPIRRTDTSIKAAAIDLLRVNPCTKDDELKVEVKRGVVIVQGVVRSRLAKQAVGDECWDIAGITDVSNQVEVSEAPEAEIGPEPVRSIMTTQVVALDASSSLRTAAEVMRDQDVGSVVVTDGGHVSGIITDRDLVVRAAADGMALGATTLRSICSEPVATVDSSEAVEGAARVMREKAIRRVVVTEEGDQPVGVVSMGDLARRRDPGSLLAEVTASPSD
jgi:CBS domain-containing protein